MSMKLEEAREMKGEHNLTQNQEKMERENPILTYTFYNLHVLWIPHVLTLTPYYIISTS